MLFCGLGAIVLVVAFSTSYHRPITVGALAWLALSVTLMLGGLQGARWAFGRERAGRIEATFAEDVAALEYHVIGTSTKVQEWLDAASTQRERSREARERLERVERILLVVAASLKDAQVFGDRLTAIERGLDTLARAAREATEQRGQESNAVEVRVEALARQLGAALEMLGKISLEMPRKEEILAEVREQLREELAAEVKAMVKAELVAGYLSDVRGRLGTGGTELRIVRGDD